MNWRNGLSKNNKFINFNLGSFKGKFMGGEESTNKWGECIKLTFIDDSGNEVTYETKSKRLLGKLSNVPEGSIVKIMRHGSGMETNYEVEIIKTAAKVLVDDLSEEKSVKDTDEWEE